MNIFLQNKDFIVAVARYDLKPQRDNTTLNSILKAFEDIDPTIESLHGCATCAKPFESTFRVILAYCENENWFEPKPKTKKSKDDIRNN